MKTTDFSPARVLGHWSHFFRSRDTALEQSGAQPAELADTPTTAYQPTEWAETEWPDTDIEPPAR